jgi:hypothetical protein
MRSFLAFFLLSASVSLWAGDSGMWCRNDETQFSYVIRTWNHSDPNWQRLETASLNLSNKSIKLRTPLYKDKVERQIIFESVGFEGRIINGYISYESPTCDRRTWFPSKIFLNTGVIEDLLCSCYGDEF